jgi:hypothetical protein
MDALKLDSAKPSQPMMQFTENEGRFKMLRTVNPKVVDQLSAASQDQANRRFETLSRAAEGKMPEQK